ncbi:hypothetical protein [Brevibacillus fortis]|uniref:hypothetical protein n=1 Tax=Brevibacillus fortis TaxID=2126352 RepID=UPI001FC95F4C|nr:hypothetical protein [Brevibacillus fortis]
MERLWTMGDEEIVTYLTSLRGIENGIVHLYGMKSKPNENDIRKIGEKWTPWRSIYSLYIWEAVGAIKRKEVFEL